MNLRRSERVGYDVTISRRDYFDGIGMNSEWVVEAKRLSDEQCIKRTFAFRWRASRFGHSPRRLGRAFEHEARSSDGVYERFTIGWNA